MSAKVTILAVTMLVASGASALAACGPALSDFQSIIDSDVKTGNLNKSVYTRINAELTRVRSACVAGRDAEAMGHLAGIKHRFGYR
jgi:hypothetical protein